MSDIRTYWLQGTQGDYQQQGAALASGGDLGTAALISLFTDRVLSPDDASVDGTDDPRGWWGDDPAFPIGSHLWLLRRAKRTDDTLVQAQGYAAEALQWLIDDGAVASFEIFAEWVGLSQLSMSVTARRSDGTSVALRFAWAWADAQSS
mgnify:CR=1 FL=1